MLRPSIVHQQVRGMAAGALQFDTGEMSLRHPDVSITADLRGPTGYTAIVLSGDAASHPDLAQWDNLPLHADPIAAGLATTIARLPAESDRLLVDYLTLALTARITSWFDHKPSDYHQAPAPIRAAIDLMHASMSASIGLDDLATAAGLSPHHLCRRFRAEVGMTPHEYLRAIRVQHAKRMLAAPGPVSLAQLALDCGFADQSHFSTVFKRVTGQTPTAYRRGIIPILICSLMTCAMEAAPSLGLLAAVA